MVQENIFTHWMFTDYLLPFILVFVLVFAILEKTNILGEGKRQINAIIGFIAGLILLAFPFSRDVVVRLIPFMIVVAVIVFVFLLLYSFVSGEKKGDPLNKGIKVTIRIAIVIALAVAVLVITDTWDNVTNFMGSSNTGANVVFIIIAILAVVTVLLSGKEKKKEED